MGGVGAAARRRRWLGALVAGALVLAPVGWVVSDHLESRNEFCTSCHLSADRPLHAALRRDFGAAPPATLAALHGTSPRLREEKGHDMRCIDCHGGTGLVGRLRVKALAAKDAAVYLTGRFDEPTGMRFPLWDEDCRKCHASFRPASEDGGAAPFHALAVHNAALPVRCVECHLAHERGGNPEAFFVHAEPVRAQCARCHAELAATP